MSDYIRALVRSYGEARASKENDVNHERYYALTQAIDALEKDRDEAVKELEMMKADLSERHIYLSKKQGVLNEREADAALGRLVRKYRSHVLAAMSSYFEKFAKNNPDRSACGAAEIAEALKDAST